MQPTERGSAMTRAPGADLPRGADRQDHDPRDQVAAHERCRQARERAYRARAAAKHMAGLALVGYGHHGGVGGSARGQREALGRRRPDPRQGARRRIRSGIHRTRPCCLYQQRRAGRDQETHQHAARLDTGRGEELRGLSAEGAGSGNREKRNFSVSVFPVPARTSKPVQGWPRASVYSALQ